MRIFIVFALLGEVVFGSVVARENRHVWVTENQGALEGDTCVVKAWNESYGVDSACFFSNLDAMERESTDGILTESLCPRIEVSSGNQIKFQLLSNDLFVDGREKRKLVFRIGAEKIVRSALRECAIEGKITPKATVDSQELLMRRTKDN